MGLYLYSTLQIYGFFFATSMQALILCNTKCLLKNDLKLSMNFVAFRKLLCKCNVLLLEHETSKSSKMLYEKN